MAISNTDSKIPWGLAAGVCSNPACQEGLAVVLQGSVGFDSTALGSLFTDDARLAQGMVGLRWRLFDFGRVDAEVAQARGREAELLAAYRQPVLQAAEDVEGTLAAGSTQNSGGKPGAADRSAHRRAKPGRTRLPWRRPAADRRARCRT